jgi:hypothetical protein
MVFARFLPRNAVSCYTYLFSEGSFESECCGLAVDLSTSPRLAASPESGSTRL